MPEKHPISTEVERTIGQAVVPAYLLLDTYRKESGEEIKLSGENIRMWIVDSDSGGHSARNGKRKVPLNHLQAYTVQQAADLLGVHRLTLYPYVNSSQLRSYRMGRRRLISREALDRFQAEMEVDHYQAMTGRSPDEAV